MFIYEFFGATVCSDIIDRKLDIVDQILFKGDKMYLKAFIIPDTDTLSLMYLKKQLAD